MGKSTKRGNLSKSIAVATIIFAVLFLAQNLSSLGDKVVNKTTKINDYKLLSESLLGLNGKKNILILFMNNAEARYGGGFIGTVGYLSVDQGKITPEPIRSVYYYDHKYEAIGYLDKFADPLEYEQYLNLRNSGRNLNGSTNLERAKIIFEKESGFGVDIVVAMTPEVLKYFLDQTGPVVLSNYKLTITPDNITETLQAEIEYGRDKIEGNDPKTILSSVANEILRRLSEKNLAELVELGRGLKDLANQRQILLFGTNDDLAKSLENIKYDGSLVPFAGDYFVLAEDNISIDKSNAFIDRQLERTASILEDGSVNIAVKITRTQTLEQSYHYIDPANGGGTFLIKPNKSLIKFAIPRGSKIDGNSTINQEYKGAEGGYDVYQFRSELEPLKPSEYSFSYTLPFRLANTRVVDFNSYIQLQNGGWPYKLTNNVLVPSSWQLLASNKQDLLSLGNPVVYNKTIDRDVFLSLIYEAK